LAGERELLVAMGLSFSPVLRGLDQAGEYAMPVLCAVRSGVKLKRHRRCGLLGEVGIV
jgi:hypothetical protein